MSAALVGLMRPRRKPFGYTLEEMRAKIVFKLMDKGYSAPAAIEQAARVYKFIAEGKKE